MIDFFLLIPLLVFSAFAQEIPDYDKPFAPIFFDKPSYSWTDKVKITILAPSWNTNKNLIDSIGDTESHPIKVSTSEHSLKPYRFTETGVNSGIFSAEVILSGFLHDANGDGNFDTTPRTTGSGPNNGFLEVDRDSAITISFEFADGVVLTESVPVSWNVATIQFTNEEFFSNEQISVKVIDVDMNLNPEAIDQIPIQVYSDSDVAGIILDATETSENSGVFVGTISLSQSSTSSGNRLFSIPGDQVFAKYDDYTLPKPYSISDNIELLSSATIDSSIPPIERIENSFIKLSDSFGNELNSFSINNQLQIVGTITNSQEHKQSFVYFFQVKNSDDSTESIAWIRGELNAHQTLDVSQSWIPKKSGDYQIQTYVWNSINDPTALGPEMSTMISVN
ncbi:hypothetical protein [Nitrosopumilus sp.]|uniref:hypothetical protein n=1 Tax=Nitrosopumilus sp. TaxID=2024843 RepID=UPI0026357ECE|nr:hypothetical protein [Nitrosopumilus sp.]